jgi:UrcA family protein
MMRTIAAIAVAAAFPGVALAQPEQAVQLSESISYSDLDLSTAQGRAALESRLAGAVRRVCPMPLNGDWVERLDARSCRRQAAEDVVKHRDAVLASRGTARVPIQVSAR